MGRVVGELHPVGVGVGCLDSVGVGWYEGGVVGVEEVLEGGTAVCVVIGEGSLWRVLGENNAAPCGYVRSHGWSVGHCVELRVEVCLFLV